MLIFNFEVAYNYHKVCDVVGRRLNSQTSLRRGHEVNERKWHIFVKHWHVRGCVKVVCQNCNVVAIRLAVFDLILG